MAARVQAGRLSSLRGTMDSLSDFLLIPAGAFLCNSIPHLAAGLRGEVFPTPFAKPRGKGPSSALVNFYWGAANLALGLFILLRVLGRHAFLPFGPAYLGAGALLIGTYLSRHFARARQSPTGFAAQQN